MSHSTRANTLSSNSTHHELLSTEDRRATSLPSQLNQNNPGSVSSSQHCAEGLIFVDDNRNHDNPHQQLYYQPEQMHTSLIPPTLPRSSPITIIRAHGDSEKEVDECDFEEDDSEIDVEGDAIKLQRKYGNKIIQTYIQDSTMMKSSNVRMPEKSSFLNAPYLGSLSKSSNQVLSLPPMSLAGDSTYLGEPPESIVSYGSLRDSHEQGRFLDGPSSYREPVSGKIRQLDHRLRYHGQQPELNIGERLQQSRKLKELRLRKESEKKEESNSNDKKGEKSKKKETKSSLSAMMKDASLQVSTGPVNVVELQAGGSFLNTEHFVSVQGGRVKPTNSHEDLPYMNRSPKNMLSTSLTAFELLKSSNTDIYSESEKASPSCPSVTRLTETDQSTAYRNLSGFQPLARSMSDPSPRFQNISLSEATTIPVLPALQIKNSITRIDDSMPDIGQRESHVQLQNEVRHETNYRLMKNDHFNCENDGHVASSGMITNQSVLFNNGDKRSQHTDHDPNMDGAFGDIDM